MTSARGTYLKLLYQHQEVILDLSNWRQLSGLVIQQSRDENYDRLHYLNYICNLIYSKITFITLVGVMEQQAVDNYPFKINLVIDGISHGVLYANQQLVLAQLNYALGGKEFIQLPKLANLEFSYKRSLNHTSLIVSSSGQLLSLTERETYISIGLAYREISFSLYLSRELMLELATTIMANNQEPAQSLTTSDIRFIATQVAKTITPKLLVQKIRQSKLAPLKDYLAVSLIINGKEYSLLLDEWQSLTGYLASTKTPRLNPLNDLVLPFSLAHGYTQLTKEELCRLATGDILLLDYYLPNALMLLLDGLNYIFQVDEENKLRLIQRKVVAK